MENEQKFSRITITLPPDLAAWVKQKQAELEAQDRRLTTSVSAIISDAVAEMKQREDAERLLLNEQGNNSPQPHDGGVAANTLDPSAGGSGIRQTVSYRKAGRAGK